MLHSLPQRWSVLSPLLDELLELDAAARAALLARHRAREAQLADELEELLALQARIDDEAFLAEPVAALLDDVGLPAAGLRVGAYTLTEPLGAGGMGSVWRARRSDGRYEGHVAVKLLNLALLARGGAERFAREGQALARLSHPNIAHLIDAGVTDSGQPYLVLEQVQGEPIDRYCDAQNLTIEARVQLLLQVLAAVAHAHGRLVLHRDLKPSNILVTADGQVKLLDFGIAKLLNDGQGAAPETALTQQAGRAFTPEFAAPEQVQGGEVTTATDVYALGVLMYVLLAGRHPTSPSEATPIERLRSVVETEPVPLSQAALRERQPRRAEALRGDLDNIAAKALKKPAAERYGSAAALADDLRRWLEDEPVSARADTWRYRAGKFARKHRVGVAAVSVIVLSLLAGVVGTTWQAVGARRERDRALFEAERALAKGNLFNLLLADLGKADGTLSQRDILERSVQLVQRQFGHDPVLASDLLLPIAGQYLSLGDAQRELAVMEAVAAHARASGDPVLIAGAACDTVDTALRLGRPEAAREQLLIAHAALAERNQAGALDWRTQTACLRAEADIAQHDGDLARATEHIRRAIALAEAKGGTQGNIYPSLLSYLGSLHRQQGEWAAAHALMQRERQRLEALGQTGSIDYVSVQRQLALLHLVWGEVAAAIATIEPLAHRWTQGGGDATPAAAPAWFDHSRAQVLLRQGALPQAHALSRGARQRALDEGNAALAQAAALALAQSLLALQRTDEADRLIAELEAAPALASHAHITPATLRAQWLLARGDTHGALSVIDAEATRLSTRSRFPAYPQALRVAAQAHLAARQPDAAASAASAALDASRRIARAPERSADVGEALLLLARVAQHSGRPTGDLARQALGVLRASLGAEHAFTREATALATP